MRPWHRALLIFFVLGSCIGCDQVSKDLAQDALRFAPAVSILGDTLHLVYAENPGIAFSLGTTLSPALRFWLFTVGAGLLLVGLVTFILMRHRANRQEIMAYGFIIGGGASNLVDRLLNDGRVIDFMMVELGMMRTAIFDLADVMILAGVVLLARALWRSMPALTPAPALPQAGEPL